MRAAGHQAQLAALGPLLSPDNHAQPCGVTELFRHSAQDGYRVGPFLEMLIAGSVDPDGTADRAEPLP